MECNCTGSLLAHAYLGAFRGGGGLAWLWFTAASRLSPSVRCSAAASWLSLAAARRSPAGMEHGTASLRYAAFLLDYFFDIIEASSHEGDDTPEHLAEAAKEREGWGPCRHECQSNGARSGRPGWWRSGGSGRC
jgi:hypothetical protein